MKPFDPWTAAHAEAKAAGEMDAWITCKNLLRFKETIEAGNGYALMRAVAYCLERGMVAPAWLSEPFAARVRTVEEGKAGSWDAVFGSPIKKNSRPNRSKITAELTERVWFAVHERIKEDGMDRKSIYKTVGKEFRLGRDVVERLYKKQQAVFDDIDRFTDDLLNPDQ